MYILKGKNTLPPHSKLELKALQSRFHRRVISGAKEKKTREQTIEPSRKCNELIR